MKHNLKSSSKGICEPLLNSSTRGKRIPLSLNPKTFLGDFLGLLRLRGFELGDWCKGWEKASPVGEGGSWRAHKCKLELGGIEINKFPGWGNHCEGC